MTTSPAGQEPGIVVRDLVKTYHVGEVDVLALRGVTLDVYPGEFVALTGPSGSGKSTFMHLVGCLDRPTAGTFLLHGRNVAEMAPRSLSAVRNKEIGFVFQGFNLLSRTTALENVELPLLYSRERARNRRERATKALENVGLGDRLDHFPAQLSGGEQQRVALARGFANHPKILFADEPTGNLDQQTGEGIVEMLEELNREARTTLVMVTHDLSLAARAHRIVSLAGGRIVSDRAGHTV